MKTDCDLTGNRYSWIGSCFYFGYLVSSLPSAWLLQHFPIAKVTVSCQIAWGILLIITGFVSNFPGLVVCRLLLGILEAPIIPGNLLMIGMWYPRREQALRLGIFYTGFAQLITGPIGYGYDDNSFSIYFTLTDHEESDLFLAYGSNLGGCFSGFLEALLYYGHYSSDWFCQIIQSQQSS